jgi:hypothetical protein
MVDPVEMDEAGEHVALLGIQGKRTPRERVLEAAIGLVDCDADDPVAYRRAWECFRRAAIAWLAATEGGRGRVRAEFRLRHPSALSHCRSRPVPKEQFAFGFCASASPRS